MISVPVVEVGVITPDGRQAPFTLVFYGIPLSEFMVTPGGGFRIREALERRGLHGYMASPFFMRQVYAPGPSPRRPKIAEPLPPLPDPVEPALGTLQRQDYTRRRKPW